MGKNIIIQESGTAKQMTVDKLKTNLADGGTQLWVPESEVSLGHKDINADGTYYASSDGYYGFEYVTVHGIGTGGGSPTGPHPTDGDGDQVISQPEPRIDPETGDPVIDPSTGEPEYELETKKVPSSIKITTPPTRLEYTDGDLIDFTELVVKAYKKATGLFTDESYPEGIIPHSELDFPVKVADYSAGSSESQSHVEGNLPQPIPYSEGASFSGITTYPSGRYDNVHWAANRTVRAFTTVNSNEDVTYCFASAEGPVTVTKTTLISYPDAEELQRMVDKYNSASAIVNGETIYYATYVAPHSADTYSFSMPTIRTNASFNSEDVYALLFGTQPGGDGMVLTVPVQWLSPYTGETFEDSFTITVNAADGGDGGGGSDDGNDGGVDAVTGADPVAGGGN